MVNMVNLMNLFKLTQTSPVSQSKGYKTMHTDYARKLI